MNVVIIIAMADGQGSKVVRKPAANGSLMKNNRTEKYAEFLLPKLRAILNMKNAVR